MRFTRKSIGLLLLAAMVFSVSAAWMVSAANDTWESSAATDWYNADYKTYTIDTAAKLAGVAKLVNSGVTDFDKKVLEVSVNLNLAAHRWVPIGTESHPFKGTLVGKAGQIVDLSGLTIDVQSKHAGFVGYMSGATVGGFHLTGDIRVAANNKVAVGSVAGFMDQNSTVFNVTNDASVRVSSTQDAYVGGIVGEGTGIISNAVNNGSVTLNGSTKGVAGGIAAALNGAAGLTLKKIENTGSVTVTNSVYEANAGGIIGLVDGPLFMAEENTNIRNSGNLSAANNKRVYSGGILGRAMSGAQVSLSKLTSNAGNIQVSSPGASGSYVGGLAGAFEQNLAADFDFKQTGAISNNAGASTYTGGVTGLVYGDFTWGQSFTNTVPINVSGAEGIYTGGIVGKAGGTATFVNAAKNAAPLQVSGSGDRVHTGGLVGFAGNRLVLNSKAKDAYSNSGSISVTGKSEVYTGGIVSNKAHAKADDNVQSKGDISVNGLQKLYTGGFAGIVSSGGDVNYVNEAFAGKITVTAAAYGDRSEVYTGGIVGYYAGNGTINSPAYAGDMAVSGGKGTYTGGVAGYVDGGAIVQAAVGRTAESFAKIASDGNVGGVAGYLNGKVTVSTVKHTLLQSSGGGGFAGGIAGQAKGEISQALIGAADFKTGESFILAVSAPNTAAGGVVGADDGALFIGSSTVNKIAVKAEARADHAKLGGLAGALSANAGAGSQAAPLRVQEVSFLSAGADNMIGGAVGENSAALVGGFLQPATNIAITSEGDRSVLGGIAGGNKGVLTNLSTDSLSVLSKGTDNKIGGTAGLTQGEIVNPRVFASGEGQLQITVHGKDSAAGGIAGAVNNSAIRGNGKDGNVTGLRMETAAEASGVRLGGIAGDGSKAAIQGAVAENLLLTASGPESLLGGLVGLMKDGAITESYVKGVLPEYAVLSVAGSDSHAGGLAGQAERAVVKGNAADYNLQNVTMVVEPAADRVRTGGLVGTNIETQIEKVFGQNVNLTAKGKQAVVGGLTGYNRGSEKAILNQNFIDSLAISVPVSAPASTVGGMIGINDARGGQADSTPIEKAVSTVQNSRIVGKVNVRAQASTTGGMIGENRSVLTNNSIAEKVPVVSDGYQGVVGGLIGKNTGTIYYVYSNAVLTVGGLGTVAGGLVGENTGKIIASYIESDLTGNVVGTDGSYALLGGLVGKNSGAIDKSFTSAKVTANGLKTYVGGLVGGHAGTVANSYAAKEVTANGKDSFAGGLIGQITTGKVKGSYSAGQVTGNNGAYAGGFAGFYANTSKDLIDNTYYLKDEGKAINSGLLDFGGGTYYELNMYSRLSPILSESLANRATFPGLSGWTFSDTAWRYGSENAAYKYPELNLSANTGGTPSGEDGGSGNDVNMNINWYTKKPSALRFTIQTEADLAGLAGIVNGTVTGMERFDFKGREIEITAPIRIQSKQWVPIGYQEQTPFEGAFIGNDHLISGLQVSAGQYAGLFGVIGSSATVHHVALEPVAVAGTQHVGSLVGLNKGSVSQIRVILSNQAKVSKGTLVGGIIGKNAGETSELSLTVQGGGKISAEAAGAIVGGLIGDSGADLHDSSVTLVQGGIEAAGDQSIVGGLIGRQAGNTATLTALIQADGSVQATGAASVAGGMVGAYVSGTGDGLSISFADGVLKATAAQSVAGGAIGRSDSGQIVKNVHLSAKNEAGKANIQGHGIVGGIIGEKTGKGTNVFDVDAVEVKGAVTTVSETGTVGGIVGKLTHAAVRNATFEGILPITAKDATIGGIAGYSYDSVIYQVKAAPAITLTAAGNGSVGGIAGIVESSKPDFAQDFGYSIPFYPGVYEASVSDQWIEIAGSGNLADVYAGTVAGQLKSASIYNSASQADLRVTGVKMATLGGVAGFSSGFIINTSVESQIQADSSSDYHVGGIAGQAAGGKIVYARVKSPNQERIKIGNSVTLSRIPSSTHVGGAVGLADAVEIYQSSASIPIEVASTNPYNTIYAGGFAGLLGDSAAGVIKQAYAAGSVNVTGQAGAYAGGFAGTVNRYAIQEASASGDVSNTAFDARGGGFAGAINNGSTIEDANAAQESVTIVGAHGATRSYAGGFAGYNDGSLSRVYERVPNVSAQAGGSNSYMGALIGYNFRNAKVADAYYTGTLAPIKHDTSGQPAPVQKADFSNYGKLPNWNFSTNGSVWGYVDGVNHNAPVLVRVMNWSFAPDLSFLSRQAKEDAQYIVITAEQLAGVALLYNDPAIYSWFDREAKKAPSIQKIILGADIALAGKLWTPIADFKGVFDGANHVISGLNYMAEQYDKYGFISNNYGTLTNVTFADARVTGGAYTGVAAGINHPGATITHVKASGGKVRGYADYTGGLVGSNAGVLSHVGIASMEVTGTNYVGGVVGASAEALKDIASTGKSKIVAAGNYAGGIAGQVVKDISRVSVEETDVSGKQYTAGIAGQAAAIAEVTAGVVNIVATEMSGGLAGEAANLSNATVGNVTLNGQSAIGGLVGLAKGELKGLSITGSVNVTGAGDQIGGLAGVASGSVEAKKLADVTVASTAGDFIGGIAGKASGESITVQEAGSILVKGTNYVGGIAGESRARNVTAQLAKVSVTGRNDVGGAAGNSSSVMDGISIRELELSGQDYVGGISGRNEGVIQNAAVKGAIHATGTAIGGLAGINAGRIVTSFSKVSIQALAEGNKAVAGGLAGNNASGASIEQSFSYGDVSVASGEANAGGLAGENNGSIVHSYHAGTVTASGKDMARAGGITGYALEGSIRDTVNTGQISASLNGVLVPGKSLFGGVAGQLGKGAILQTNYFDTQMLQQNTAYANDEGYRIKPDGTKAIGVKTSELVKGALLPGMETSMWKTIRGYYPQLAHFAGSTESDLSTAAVVLSDSDTAYHVTDGYTPTPDLSLRWTTGNAGSETILTVSKNGESRSIALNKKPVLYAETAAKPAGTAGQEFKEKIEVTLGTTEPGGTIYYTLNGKDPSENALVYTQPILLDETTTIKAITVAEGKNNSDPFTAVYKKFVPAPGGNTGGYIGGGGGGGGIPSTGGKPVEVLVNGKFEVAGTETIVSNGTAVTTTIAMNEQLMDKLLEQQGDKAEITIVFKTAADTSIGELSGELIKKLESKKAVLKLKTDKTLFIVPAEQLQKGITAQLGNQVPLKDIKVRIEVGAPAPEQVKQLENAAQQGGFKVLTPPSNFKATYTYGQTTAEIGKFDTYVERALVVSDEATARQVTTGVMVEPDGTVVHVPTKIKNVDSKIYAVISSPISRGTVSLVHHSVTFKDVENHWGKELVNEMGSRMVVGGVGNGLFEPDRAITRAEFAAIVVKALGLKADAAGASFSDVKDGDWYSPYIQAAYANGIISGYENGQFGSMDNITREQAMTIVARAMKITGLEADLAVNETSQTLAGFSDAGLISDYAKAGIAASVKAGLVSGRSSSQIAPGDNMSRAEVAAIVQKLLQRSGLI
ncbi:S-layer homology domain-containing protein [Paenibacillus tyrfis]|uniref:S-layer homology domain-containing protein n=1 Tax=Paenibacillus tyrfis TaxID=1501230 RepID=UPI00055C7A3A|nr:S-layer homology domain-containing protein [Paenibacillus tyrfis]